MKQLACQHVGGTNVALRTDTARAKRICSAWVGAWLGWVVASAATHAHAHAVQARLIRCAWQHHGSGGPWGSGRRCSLRAAVRGVHAHNSSSSHMQRVDRPECHNMRRQVRTVHVRRRHTRPLGCLHLAVTNRDQGGDPTVPSSTHTVLLVPAGVVVALLVHHPCTSTSDGPRCELQPHAWGRCALVRHYGQWEPMHGNGPLTPPLAAQQLRHHRVCLVRLSTPVIEHHARAPTCAVELHAVLGAKQRQHGNVVQPH